MNHSESIAKLAAALVKVNGEIEHAHKNATNPHFRNRYADLTEVIDTTRPVLAKHGLSVVQLPGYSEGITTLDTILLHESGEWISGTAGARVQKDDPQGVGSALTYLRRYSLAAVVGIGQEDDDGERAVRREAAHHEAVTASAERTGYPAQQPSSQPNGVKHSNVPHESVEQEGARVRAEVAANRANGASFNLDAKAAGKKAEGKTWRQLIADPKGRGYVEWCAKKPFPDAETALHLQAALALAKLGDPDFSDQYGVELPEAVGR